MLRFKLDAAHDSVLDNMKNTKIICVSMLCFLSSVCSTEGIAAPTKDKGEGLGLRSSYSKCSDASGGVTVALLNCAAAEFIYQDERLNKAYKTLMEKLGASGQAKLRDEEKKWIAYRDSYCAVNLDSGTAADIESSGCKVEETAKQATALEARPGQSPVLTQYHANTIGLRPSYMKCIKINQGIGLESQGCMDAEYEFQKNRLNKARESLMTKSSESEKSKLRISEKIWISFRDAHCAPAVDGGQSRHSVPNDCLVEETAKQSDDLENRLFLKSLGK